MQRFLMMQAGRIAIGLLAILIAVAIALGADQRIVTILFRLLEGVMLLLSLLAVAVRSLRLRLAFKKGWVIKKRDGNDVVRIAEQPGRFWLWTAIEGVFLFGATAFTALWVWLLMQGWNSD